MAKKTTKKKVAKKKTIKKVVKKAIKKTVKAKSKPAKKTVAKKPVAAPKKQSTSINPYLTFAGNCEAAFNFYKSVFGGKFGYVGRFKEMPPMDGKPFPASEGEKIMHISLAIGESILMGSDSSDAFGHATVMGNNFSISINAASRAEADKIFHSISAGGKITMPMNDTFWGSYFGMCVDKFGIAWMMSYDKPTMKK